MNVTSDVWKEWVPPTKPIWTPEHALSKGCVGIYLVIDGNNASSKSTVFEYLRRAEQIEKLKLMLHPGEELIFLEEPVKSRASEIEKWYESFGNASDSSKKSDIVFEFATFQWRMQQQEERLKNFCGIAIGERPTFAGFTYYLPALHKLGKVTDEDYHNYMAIVGELLKYSAFPQILETLHTDAPVCGRRAQEDGNRQPSEKAYLTPEYLSALEDEILGLSTVRLVRYCQRHEIPRPQIPRFDTTKGVEQDKTLRVRIADDIYERVTTIIKEQRDEIARRKDAASGLQAVVSS